MSLLYHRAMLRMIGWHGPIDARSMDPSATNNTSYLAIQGFI